MNINKNTLSQHPMISIRNVYKSFASNAVLKGINLDVMKGDVVALIGGNGAGKSTLMKIIMGIHPQDKGEIFINGKKVHLNKPSAALANGIYLVPQEPMLFPNMTVEENIILGFNERQGDLRNRLVKLIEKLGWKLKLERRADTLSIAEQQLVEILRGLLRNTKILILDEPTSALTFHETKSLFKIITDLHNNGISIFYITHRLSEVFEIATHVAIMRDGKITLNGPVNEFDKEILIKGLLPENSSSVNIKSEKHGNDIDYTNLEPVFEAKSYSGYGFENINLKIYPGEILGVAGVVGAGRTEFATTVFGIDESTGGQVFLNGKNITGKKTRKIIDLGLNYVPEDRHLNGIFNISDIIVNTTSAKVHTISKFFLNSKAEKNITQKYMENFHTKATGQDQLIGSLSGGNQQKVVIARALTTDPKLIILDEPTRGVDAGARSDVYAIINLLKQQGVAILLISSDLEEIVELSDRAITMFQGKINHIFDKKQINLDNLMAASFGVYKEEV